MNDSLILMGTGDSLGVPRVYCDCPVCNEARQTGANRRTRCSAFVRAQGESFWIDCGPDWRHQMEVLGLREVSALLITHAHHDHIGGLPDVFDLARWTKTKPRVIAPTQVISDIEARYPWIGGVLQMEPFSDDADGSIVHHIVTPPTTFNCPAIGGCRITSRRVCHGANGHSYAYRFNRPGFSWAYCPDSINLDSHEREFFRDLDLLILGTAYHKETAPIERRSLYDMTEALELLEDIDPKRAIFTHLSHGVDVTRPYPLNPKIALGRDGLIIDL